MTQMPQPRYDGRRRSRERERAISRRPTHILWRGSIPETAAALFLSQVVLPQTVTLAGGHWRPPSGPALPVASRSRGWFASPLCSRRSLRFLLLLVIACEILFFLTSYQENFRYVPTRLVRLGGKRGYTVRAVLPRYSHVLFVFIKLIYI